MFRKFAVQLNNLRVMCNPVVSPIQSRFSSSYVECNDNPKILITGKYLRSFLQMQTQKKNYKYITYKGGLGQLGIECAKLLRGKYGADSVILSDIIKPTRTLTQGGPYIFADILDFKVSNEKKSSPYRRKLN